jgi:predicted PurR-regulated permease PerM
MHALLTGWRLLIVGLLCALILATAGLLVITTQIAMLIFAGVLFGLLLGHLSRKLSGRTPLAYRQAYLLVAAIFSGFLAGGLYYSGSRIVQKIYDLTNELQAAFAALIRRAEDSAWGPYLHDFESQIEHLVNDGSGLLPEIMTAATWIIWGVTAVIVILFVGLYVAFDPNLYTDGMVKLIPPKHRPRARTVITKLHLTLLNWILARVIAMLIIGVATAIGLWILGVPLPLTLGAVAALLTFIPNLGPVLATVPQALLAFQVSPSTVLYVLIFNASLQAIESYLITPVVLRYEVSLPPALTVCAQLLMTVLFGAIGIVMAAPLTATIIVLIQTLYVQDTLGDPDPGELAG